MNLKRRLQNLEATAAGASDAQHDRRERIREFRIALLDQDELLDALRGACCAESAGDPNAAEMWADASQRIDEWARANGFADLLDET